MHLLSEHVILQSVVSLSCLQSLLLIFFLQNFEVALFANLDGAGEIKGITVPNYSMAYRIVEWYQPSCTY
jgi:hypothetical protein